MLQAPIFSLYTLYFRPHSALNESSVPVLLTIEGEEPQGEKYCVLDHNAICEIIDNTANLYRHLISDDVYKFIQDYCENLTSDYTE